MWIEFLEFDNNKNVNYIERNNINNIHIRHNQDCLSIC
jgi:hypothetical protein